MVRPRKREPEAESVQQQQTTYGVDYGSGGWRMAVFRPDSEESEVVVMGCKRGQDGVKEDSDNYPPHVVFQPASSDVGEPGWKFLGFEAITDPRRTSSGLKQSLDPKRLCQPETQGARFLALCKEYGRDNVEILRESLKILLKFVKDQQARVNFAVPAIWARGKRGIGIQRLFLKCAAEAGFVNIGVDTEQGAIAAFLAWSETRNSGISRKVFTVDFGSGTVDGGYYLLRDGRALLLAPPIGCGGGIDDAKRSLSKKCDQLSASNQSLVEHALRYLYELHKVDDDKTDDFEFDQYRIPKSEFQDMIDRCYREGFALSKKGICNAGELDEVIVSGGAPTSNKRIEAMLRRLLGECNKERKSKFKPFEIRFLDPKIAKRAVCKGASIPYSLDWKKEFHDRAFGILYQDGGTPSILALKEPESTDILADWVAVRLSTDPKRFIIEPHTIEPEAKAVGKDKELGLYLYSQDAARPMGGQAFNLSGRREIGDSVWVRFKRDTRNSAVLVLQIHCEDRKGIIARRLRYDVIDRDGLSLRRARKRGDELSDIDEESDEAESDDEIANGRGKQPAEDGGDRAVEIGTVRRSLSTARVTRRGQRQTDKGKAGSEADEQAEHLADQQLVEEQLAQGNLTSGQPGKTDVFEFAGSNQDHDNQPQGHETRKRNAQGRFEGSRPKTPRRNPGGSPVSRAANSVETGSQQMEPRSPPSSHRRGRRAASDSVVVSNAMSIGHIVHAK